MSLPKAPASEDAKDACCAECGSLFHPTADHPAGLSAGFGLVSSAVPGFEFPGGYDPGEADRLIGRDPHAGR